MVLSIDIKKTCGKAVQTFGHYAQISKGLQSCFQLAANILAHRQRSIESTDLHTSIAESIFHLEQLRQIASADDFVSVTPPSVQNSISGTYYENLACSELAVLCAYMTSHTIVGEDAISLIGRAYDAVFWVAYCHGIDNISAQMENVQLRLEGDIQQRKEKMAELMEKHNVTEFPLT